MENRNIKEISFSDLTNWSVQYLFDTSFSYNQKFNLIKIGEFLYRNKTPILIQDNIDYKRVTIKINNGGIFLRDTVKGINIGTKKQFVINKGQFLLSKIDARNGAFGVVPKEVDNGIITGNFWTFDVDYNIINPHFLSLIATTPEFIKFSENASNGTTNRHYLQEDLFLAQQIPLPSLEEQNRIVANYNKRIQLANKQDEKAKQLETEIENYLFNELGIEKLEEKEKQILKLVNYSNLDRWDNTKSFILNSKYPVIKVKNIIIDISTGTTPPTSRNEYFDNGNINFYTPADLTDKMYLLEAKRKVTKLAFDDGKSRMFFKDTILFVGIGSTVGKVGIVANEFATSNQQITGLYFDNSKTNIEYIYHFFNQFSDITTIERTQATIPIVNQDKILNIPIPLPPIKIQNKIVNHISKLKQQIKKLQEQAKENRKMAIQEFENEIFIKN